MINKDQFLTYFLQINLKLLVPLLFFGFVIGYLRQKSCANFNKKPFGDFIINFFNLVGVPIHELGHLIFGLLFGYQITSICLYRTQKQAARNGGTLGYVNMRHSSRSLPDTLFKNIGTFFIGIGPLLFGPAVIFIIAHFLPDKITKIVELLTYMIEKKQFDLIEFKHWFFSLNRIDYLLFFLFLYLVIGIGLNLELSRADLITASHGVIFFELLIVLVICICVILKIDLIAFVEFLQNRLFLISTIGIASSVFVFLISLI